MNEKKHDISLSVSEMRTLCVLIDAELEKLTIKGVSKTKEPYGVLMNILDKLLAEMHK